MDYRRGIRALKTSLPAAVQTDFATLESRLLSNLRDERLFGTTEQLRSDRARIIASLNDLAGNYLSRSFNDLCQADLNTNLPATPQKAQSELSATSTTSEQHSDTENTDVGIVIALAEEFRELHQEIAKYCNSVHNPSTGDFDYVFDRACPNQSRTYRCVATFVGAMGLTVAGLTAHRLISHWQPRTLVMLGIAGALNQDINIGDVVVASQVDGYMEQSKATSTADHDGFVLQFGGETYRCSPDLVKFVQNFEFANSTQFQQWRDECTAELHRLVSPDKLVHLLANGLVREQVHLADGPVASGPTVGASPKFTAWLKTRNRKYFVLEMESAGLMAAVYQEADPRRTLVIRAVSDYADERKSDLDKVGQGALRRYAMRNAIRLLWGLMDAGALPLSMKRET